LIVPTETELLIESYLGRATPEMEAAVGTSLDPRLREFLTIARAGEDVVAFELFCSNIREFDVRISTAEYDRLAHLAGKLGVGDDKWRCVEALVGSEADQ
jgi:hypothetical protein